MFKGICLVVFMFVSISSYSQSRNHMVYKGDSKAGLSLALGGVLLTGCGFLTTPLYTSTNVPNSTSAYNYNNTPLPFYQQGPRFGTIVCGVTLTLTGLITMACGK